MSTYAVFGMTRPKARTMAKQAVWKKSQKDGEFVAPDEFERRVAAETDKIMAGTNTLQLSEKFDAPHFAVEYLELAKRTTEARSLSIKAYCQSGERSPTTGRPKMQWVEIDSVTLEPKRAVS